MTTVLLALFVAASIGGQSPPARFSTRSDLVVLHVTVLDRDGMFVPGLTRDRFVVHEDGRSQSIEFLERVEGPLTLGLVIDSSISMQRNRPAILEAARSLIDASDPADEMFTLNFNERVWPGLPTGRAFTSDRRAITRALRQSGARGRTALFDALDSALSHLMQGSRQKKVLVVISDGGDNASTAPFDQVLDRALRMNAVIYSISLRDEYNREGNRGVLEKLAAVTGGQAFFPRSPAEAKRMMERIAREFRSGYMIGYVPRAVGQGYRAIRVEAHSEDGRRLAVRARSGYVAASAGVHQ